MPENQPYLYRCPNCKELFHDRETARKHIKHKHYSSAMKKAAQGSAFFSWEPDGTQKQDWKAR